LIQECFRHVRGVGPKTALLLNERGFISWDDCAGREHELPLNGERRTRFIMEMQQSARALEENDIGYFISSFPTSEHWRILARYFRSATFIDVETTGLSWHTSHASVITALHRGGMHAFKYGENLEAFLDLAEEAELLVTFNGNCFDIPFLERTFNIPSICCPHIDLRWVAWHRGHSGGLKCIERGMGLGRPSYLEGIDGLEAVDLFNRWMTGDAHAMETLVRYCAADTISTYLLAERLLAQSGCGIKLSDPSRMYGMIGALY
jgi:uncharacterized protein YprB with RNaseH-like and TPR domain